MTILGAIAREERRLEKQLGKLQHRLDVLRTAAKALGHSAEREVVGAKKRVLSAAGRATIVKAAKKRWAKVRKQAKKVTAYSPRHFTVGRGCIGNGQCHRPRVIVDFSILCR
jgi:hypothetical protein